MSSVNRDTPSPLQQPGIQNEPETSKRETHVKAEFVGDRVTIGSLKVPLNRASIEANRGNLQPDHGQEASRASEKTLSNMLDSIKNSVGKFFKTSLKNIKNLATTSKKEGPKIAEKQSEAIEKPKTETQVKLRQLEQEKTRLINARIPLATELKRGRAEGQELTKARKQALEEALAKTEPELTSINQQIGQIRNQEKIKEKTEEMKLLKMQHKELIQESKSLVINKSSEKEISKSNDKIIEVLDRIVKLSDEIDRLNRGEDLGKSIAKPEQEISKANQLSPGQIGFIQQTLRESREQYAKLDQLPKTADVIATMKDLKQQIEGFEKRLATNKLVAENFVKEVQSSITENTI